MINDSRQRYEIESVRKADPPPEAEGNSPWYRYVITQGANRIKGYRQGSLKNVTVAVKKIVAQLNERQSGKRSPAAPKRKTQN